MNERRRKYFHNQLNDCVLAGNTLTHTKIDQCYSIRHFNLNGRQNRVTNDNARSMQINSKC